MSEWISIKDVFPSNDIDEVLVTDGINYYVAVDWKLPTDIFHSYCCGCYVSDITHWMPLPKLPKENNNE